MRGVGSICWAEAAAPINEQIKTSKMVANRISIPAFGLST
jgi:hypothetical protein